MAVYGNNVTNYKINMLEESMNNDMNFFKSILESDSYALESYVLNESVNVKEIINKIKGYWDKFKTWIGEKFKQIKMFVLRKISKIPNVGDNLLVDIKIKDIVCGKEDKTNTNIYTTFNDRIIYNYCDSLKRFVDDMKRQFQSKESFNKFNVNKALATDGALADKFDLSIVHSEFTFEGKLTLKEARSKIEKINTNLNGLIDASDKGQGYVNSVIKEIDNTVNVLTTMLSGNKDPNQVKKGTEFISAFAELTTPLKRVIQTMITFSSTAASIAAFNVNQLKAYISDEKKEDKDQQPDNENK